MFTSRAEFRILLRQDNADLRLLDKAKAAGLISERRYRQTQAKAQAVSDLKNNLQDIRVEGIALNQWIKRPANFVVNLPQDIRRLASEEIWTQVENDLKYEGYIRRELDAVARQQKQEEQPLPTDLDYAAIPGLRNESRQKFVQVRPTTLGQASRISGVTPADISLLAVWLRKLRG